MTSQFLLIFAVILATAISTMNAKTVVIYPPPSTSYFVFHTNIASELASLGHEVWICVPYFMLPKNVVKNKNVKILVYGEHLGDLEAKIFGSSRMIEKFWTQEYTIEVTALYYHSKAYTTLAREILSDKKFLEKVRLLKPDLLVVDSVIFNMNMIILPYMLDIPYALIGVQHDIVLSKVPFSPAAPHFIGTSLTDKMSFSERLLNTVYYIACINFDMFYDSSIVSEFAPHKPYKSINDIAANAEIFIAEIDHILDYPRTTLPNTKLVGGSSASPAKPLEGEFKTFVEESKNGIIVVSFGGSVVNIPHHISSKMISVFKQLDLRVVWRINITSPEPKQIMTSMWLPQNDLLGHEKTKLFISHCGKNGQYEALYHAVPIFCLPIFGDQYYNSERVRVKQLGLRADMREASADEMASLMKEIIYDKKYSENMKKASLLYRELYKVPKKEAAYWLDHVIKYGGEYMRSYGQQMPWYQLFALDVIAFLIVIFFLLITVLYVLIKQCYFWCTGKRKTVRNKSE